MNSDIWQLQEAKSKFSQLVEKALNNSPQIVTKHGNNAVVVLSYDKYMAISKPQIDLVEFFQQSPLCEIDLDLNRNKDLPRDIKF